MSRLQDKVALVTGAASNPGLGRAIALRFAQEGAKLIITDINEEGLKAAAEDIKALGVEVAFWHQDVTSEQDWLNTIERIETQFGRLDVLVNNAGIAVLRTVHDMTMAEYDRQMSVNMTSVFLGSKYGVGSMKKTGGGSIVNLSSVAGLVGIPGTGAYGASKAGVRMLSKTVALENARENIRCNSIHPGVIWTNIQQDAIRDNPEQYEIINESVPMGRMGQPEEVANCALFLACDESSYVTGTELTVDGGMVAQ